MEPAAAATAHRPRPPTILLVDNEEGMLEVCAETLDRMGPVALVIESSPRRAAERLERETFDLMISNIQMPEMTGIQLLRLARERAPRMPVLMLTGYPMAETAQRCRDLGAAGYMTKPFRPEDLMAKVRELLAAA